MSSTESGSRRARALDQVERTERIDDFQNPRYEWRRLFSELLGTFLLVMAAAGATMMNHAFSNEIGRGAAVVAPGLMVMAIIMFMGRVSGAHLNPAVTLAFSLRGDFPWKRAPGYVLAQVVGTTLAALFTHAVVKVSAIYGSNNRRTVTRISPPSGWKWS